ncbi:PHP domain-containing protein [soil metagenome]
MANAEDEAIEELLSGLELRFGNFTPGTMLADLHVHTTFSDGWWEPGPLAEHAVAIGLAAVAITDHDDIRAGMVMADYCAQRSLPLTVYAGCEVTARDGRKDVHVLGIGLADEIRPWQSVEQTVEDIVRQGGLAVMPHPSSAKHGRPTFEQILALEQPVGIEIFNASAVDLQALVPDRWRTDSNQLTQHFYEKHAEHFLGAVGGTDAHFRTVGRGLTGYQGELLDAIRNRRTTVWSRGGRERLLPQDLVGYLKGLQRMRLRRSRRWT